MNGILMVCFFVSAVCVGKVKAKCPHCGSPVDRISNSHTSENVGSGTSISHSTVGSRPAGSTTSHLFSTLEPKATNGLQSSNQLCDSKPKKETVLTRSKPQIIPMTCTTTEIQTSVPRLAHMAVQVTSVTHGIDGSLIQIRYILCKNMFSAPVKEKKILQLNVSTLHEFYNSVKQVESISSDLSLEVFSHEGYPLHPNEFTSQCMLNSCIVIVVNLNVLIS